MSAIRLAEKLAQFDDHWAPRRVASFNGHKVMVVKVLGEFNWHSHADTDDFFLVLEGEIDIEMPGKTVTLAKGDLYVVPATVEHRPVARTEAHLLLIEKDGTPNTGDEATAAQLVDI
ncbi:MAG: cupin domain-containing protein [Pseudomonadota bacterium]